MYVFFFSSRRRHTRLQGDWSSDVCSSDLGPTDPRITVRTRLRGEEVIIVVEDNGPGIAAEVMGRLFEPSVTTKPEGHGFGLSTCYRIVKNHGGKITAD